MVDPAARRSRHGDTLRRPDALGPSAYRFAPYELAFCGHSGAGKTTLITALIRELASTYRIAYVKHDAHVFAMDREGKDTFRAAESGARPVLINDEERFALLGSGEVDPALAPLLFQEADFVFVEGLRRSELPKVVVVDPQGAILDEVESKAVNEVVAFVLRREGPPEVAARAERAARSIGEETAGGAPALLFSDELPGIRDLLLRHFAAKAAALPLYGRVVSGGRSTRMHRDKAAIPYHGIPQVRWAADLLGRVCARVFVSTRADQQDEGLFAGLEQLHDRFVEIGPMGGILTALHAHPGAVWLVLGCDLPFVTIGTLEELLRRRDPYRLATCYDSAEDGLPEPLCAIYEPSYRLRLHQLLATGRTCPRKALIRSRSRRLAPTDPRALDNVNDPEESRAASLRLAGGKG